MKSYIRILIIFLALGFALQDARGAWGDFDTTFGFLGLSLDGVSNHYPLGVAVQSDGKILVTGYRMSAGKQRFFLRRYLPSGQIDTSFGDNGSAVSNGLIDLNANYKGEKIVIQENGKIAVLGDARVWRFYSSGTADTSMGSGGMKTFSGYTSTFARQIATYANILYIGLAKDPYTPVVIKLNSNGSRDMTFGTSGEMIPGSHVFFTLATETSTGNILVGGKKTTSSMGIERFSATGQLDTTFESYDTAYQGAPGLYPNRFIQLSQGGFVLNETWYPIAPEFPPSTTGANLVRFNSNGSYVGRTEYVTPQQNVGVESGSCPDILAQQSDSKVIARSVHRDTLYRFSSNFSTIQTMDCDSYASLENPTNAVLNTNNRMIAAGRYNGNIAIVRTLP